MKFVSCGICFAPVKIKETVVIEHKRVCMKCRGKAK